MIDVVNLSLRSWPRRTLTACLVAAIAGLCGSSAIPSAAGELFSGVHQRYVRNDTVIAGMILSVLRKVMDRVLRKVMDRHVAIGSPTRVENVAKNTRDLNGALRRTPFSYDAGIKFRGPIPLSRIEEIWARLSGKARPCFLDAAKILRLSCGYFGCGTMRM